VAGLRHSSFVIDSSFWFRHSGFIGPGIHALSTRIFAAAAVPSVRGRRSLGRTHTASASASRTSTVTFTPGISPHRSTNWRNAGSWSSTRAMRQGLFSAQSAKLPWRDSSTLPLAEGIGSPWGSTLGWPR